MSTTTEPTGGTITADPEVREVPAEPGDHERLSHYARKEAITYAAVYSVPIKALCGKEWIPSRDPKKFPVCPTCKEIWEGFKDE